MLTSIFEKIGALVLTPNIALFHENQIVILKKFIVLLTVNSTLPNVSLPSSYLISFFPNKILEMISAKTNTKTAQGTNAIKLKEGFAPSAEKSNNEQETK